LGCHIALKINADLVPKLSRPLILVGVWGTAGTIVSICGASLFDKIGRRKSFFISISGVLLGSIMLVTFWARFEAGGNTSKTLGSLAIFSMFVFLVGFGWIMNAFAYTYPPEILPTDIRAAGMGLGFGIKMGRPRIRDPLFKLPLTIH
jgi:MFS family permease